MTINQRKPDLYLSMPHPCSYLPERTSTIVFVDPQCVLDEGLYGSFVRQGFRRSGDLVYRPYCQNCSACVPVRIPVHEFRPSRGQKRTWKKNRDIVVRAAAPEFSQEHFDLYRRYQSGRHYGSSMDDPDPQRYVSFLASRQAKTVFYELRAGSGAGPDVNPDTLLAVAVVDILPDGLSAVYTFYEPDLPARGLGVYAILWQIAQTRHLGLPFLYLGYWIKETPKMAYKTQFRPLHALRNGRWSPVTVDEPTP
jgi:arginine-tRNA-protein transferase